MPRINRRARVRPQGRPSRAQILELLLGPDGESVFESAEQRSEVWDAVRAEISPAFERQWCAAQAAPKSFAPVAEQYARQVVSGEIPAGSLVRAACQRHLDDLERAAGTMVAHPDWDYEFSAAKADRVCRFLELLPHTKGKWAAHGELLVLSPWQGFIVCSIFGWLKCESQLRRFSLAYIEVSRKNGKSQLAAGIGLYCFAADNEHGAEVYSGATTEKQAMEVFRPAMKMMEQSPELAMVLGLAPPASKKLSIAADGSRFEPVVRRPGDGASPHAAIVDEYHEHDNDALFDTFRTGMGAREQPLELVITTAGVNLGGPCKALRGDVEKVLEGWLAGDEVFGLIYSIDPEDDWTSEAVLAKANPNIGVSVFREFLLTEQRAAIAKPRKQGIFKTKHLCVWVGANEAYFDSLQWARLGDVSLKIESFAGLPCFAAVDLSGKKDFTARAFLFKKICEGKEHFFAFLRFYLPEAQVNAPENQHYQGWHKSGHLVATPGNVIDFDLVMRETAAAVKQFKPKELAYDPWNAEQLVQGVESATRVTPAPIPQNVGRLNAPMQELDALIADGRIHHDGNPVMAWMLGNVVAHEDANENVFPRKELGHEESKIDGAVALIMAVSRSMAAPPVRSVYSSRGVRSIEVA